MRPPVSAAKRKHSALSNLNEDVLLALVQWFEALELLGWGMTCKRLYQTIGSINLWTKVAQRLQEASIHLPLDYGENIEGCSLLALQRITSKACRLQRNLDRSEPILYRFTRISPSRNPFKRDSIPEEASDCIHIFDGRWIFYRRPDHVCVRHIEATKQKEIHNIPIMGYAGWSFQVAQTGKNVALVTIRHDVNEVWSILEFILGEDKSVKPKVRPIDIGEPYKVWLAGSSLATMTKNGVNRVSDLYTGQQMVLDHEYSIQREYLYSNDYFFSLQFQPGGRIQLTAQRVDRSQDKLLGSSKSTLTINLKNSFSSYPPDQFFAVASIRAVSNDLLTVWHRVHMKVNGQIYYAHFMIEIPYAPAEDDSPNEVVKWGDWCFRTTYVANGQQCVGQYGTSLVLARHLDGRASLTVYPRFRLPLCDWDSKISNQGVSLPVPNEKIPGTNVHAIRVAWDDVRGILVLMLESGMIWVLHYA